MLAFSLLLLVKSLLEIILVHPTARTFTLGPLGQPHEPVGALVLMNGNPIELEVRMVRNAVDKETLCLVHDPDTSIIAAQGVDV